MIQPSLLEIPAPIEPGLTPTTGGAHSCVSTPVATPGRTAVGVSHGCAGCRSRWAGSRTAHCAAPYCHRTFSGVGPFDAHRLAGRCVDPVLVGMALVSGRPYPCWGYPADAAAGVSGVAA